MVRRNETRFVNSKRDGKYKIFMSWDHEQTLIHVQPQLEHIKEPTEPPQPDEMPTSHLLAIAIAVALFLFILALLILFCCCCAGCPIYECRKRRRKKLMDKEKEAEWKHNSVDFKTPLFTPPVDSRKSNGFVPPMEDVPQSTTAKFQSAPPPQPPRRQSTSQMASSEASGRWYDDKMQGPGSPSEIASSDLANGFSASFTASEVDNNVTNVGRGGNSHRLNAHYLSNLPTHTYSRQTIGGISERRTAKTTALGIEAVGREISEEIWWIDSCVITSDSRYLVTGSKRSSPCVWDLKTGHLLRNMEGSDTCSSDLTLTAHDRVLVGLVSDNGLDKKRMQIWDLNTTSRIHMSYPVFASALCSLNYSPRVVIFQYDPQSNANPALVIWDVEANQEYLHIPFQHPIGMSPEGGITFLKVTSDDRLVVAGFESTHRFESCYMVFDLLAQDDERIIDPLVIPLVANLDCTVILPGKQEALTGTHNGRLVVWSLMSGQPVRQLITNATPRRETSSILGAPHQKEVIMMALSANGKLLVSGDKDGLLHFWNAQSERWTASVAVPFLSSVAISNDSSIVATGSAGQVHLWTGNGGHPIGEMSTALDITSLVLAQDKSAIVALGKNKQRHSMIILSLVRDSSRTNGRAHDVQSFLSLQRGLEV